MRKKRMRTVPNGEEEDRQIPTQNMTRKRKNTTRLTGTILGTMILEIDEAEEVESEEQGTEEDLRELMRPESPSFPANYRVALQ
jgi:hypothetical protein